MRIRRTLAPRSSRPRATTRLRQLVAAALALPLVLGGMAATALPATADVPRASISHVGTATVGVTTSATFSCIDDPQHPVVAAGWYTSSQDTVMVVNPTPGQGVFTFTRDFVFNTAMFPMVGLACDYSPLADGTEAYYTNAMVNVTEALLVTTTTVSVQPASVEPHNPINASATVTTPGGPASEGRVQFSIDGEWIGSEIEVDGSGVASLAIPNPGWGTHTVTAEYFEGWTYKSSTSVAATVWVKPAPSVSIAVPAQVHVPDVVLRATVPGVSGLAAPTGTVTFRSNEGALGTATIVDGEAVLPLPTLSPGTYDVFAVYSGDETYGASSSDSSTMTVDAATIPPAPTAPVVTVPAAVTTPVATQATFTVGLGTEPRPTGTVTVSEGSVVISSSAVPHSGDLTLTLPVLSPGTHTLVVRTAASATALATEHTFVLTVTGEPATGSPTPDADLTGSTSTLTVGASITLVARDFLPGETVAFYLHSDPIFLGTAVADADGVARLTVPLPAGTPLGQHHVQATGGTSLRWAQIAVTVTAVATAVVPVTTPVTTPAVVSPTVVPVVSPATTASAAVPAPAALAQTGAPVGSMLIQMSFLVGSGVLLLVGRRRMVVAAG